ncbi:DUF2442 domain-containing protein [Rubrolithibacter danxiaensis]|uniref:DUF2442 domain-containing protein n=1 Tax=Rubrolithibacter danxiaensis TaxID=3390805 RepID=UPI003BF79D8E
MRTALKAVEIKDVQFIGSSAMLLALSNDRTFIIPLEKFEDIAGLTPEEQKNFEIIDGDNLTFLAIDEIYNLHQLIGI